MFLYFGAAEDWVVSCRYLAVLYDLALKLMPPVALDHFQGNTLLSERVTKKIERSVSGPRVTFLADIQYRSL